MKVYDHDNKNWFENPQAVSTLPWQRHCGVLFAGDECPACRTKGWYSKYMEVAFAPTPAPDPLPEVHDVITVPTDDPAYLPNVVEDPAPDDAPAKRGRKPKLDL